MAFSAETSREGNARFKVAGMPMAYRRLAMFPRGRRYFLRMRTWMGRRKYTARYTAKVSVWPMPVARAAPSMPRAGKGPRPKISTGSSRMLATQPHSMLAMVVFMAPTDWNSFSKTSPSIIMTVKLKATLEYRVPRPITAWEVVNIPKKAGIRAMPATVSTTPWTKDSASPWEAARSASSRWPAPRCREITALMPTPKPMPTALIKFWMGKTRERAVMASSLICATKKLSTMLYREFTSMERAMGSPIESSSGSTGRSFIKVSFIAGSFASGGWHKKATQLVKIAVWRKGTCSGKIHPKSFTGAIIRESRPLVKGFPGPAPRPAAGPSPPAGQSRCAAQRSAPPPAPASGTGRCLPGPPPGACSR